MKIVYDYPPNIEAIKKHFELVPHVVFTYGDTLYVPEESEVSGHLMAHEEVHAIQQGSTPDKWWDEYFANPEFRLQQELGAYREQYKYFRRHNSDRNKCFRFLDSLARDLCGPIYGRCVGYMEALKLIQE